MESMEVVEAVFWKFVEGLVEGVHRGLFGICGSWLMESTESVEVGGSAEGAPTRTRARGDAFSGA